MPTRSVARWALILLAGLAIVYVAGWAILPEARKSSLYGAGDAAARVGGWPEALARFRTLAELDPDYRDVQDRLDEALCQTVRLVPGGIDPEAESELLRWLAASGDRATLAGAL